MASSSSSPRPTTASSSKRILANSPMEASSAGMSMAATAEFSDSEGEWIPPGSEPIVTENPRACSSDKKEDSIPDELVAALQAARPACPFFGKRRGCRKGRKCPLRHADDNNQNLRLPHVSRHLLPDGRTRITLRPPLAKGLELFFKEHGAVMPLSHGEAWDSQDGQQRFVTYQCVNMVAHDALRCREAEHRSGIRADPLSWHGASSKEFSKLLLHSTSLENALAILKDGHIRPGPGICGNGVYGFELASADDRAALESVWNRGASGGYNGGAAFVLATHGILIKGHSSLAIPPGATAWLRDQFAASPASIQYLSVTFDREGLLAAVGQQMTQLGYTPELHVVLKGIRDHFASSSSSSTAGGAPPSSVNRGFSNPEVRKKMKTEQEKIADSGL